LRDAAPPATGYTGDSPEPARRTTRRPSSNRSTSPVVASSALRTSTSGAFATHKLALPRAPSGPSTASAGSMSVITARISRTPLALQLEPRAPLRRRLGGIGRRGTDERRARRGQRSLRDPDHRARILELQAALAQRLEHLVERGGGDFDVDAADDVAAHGEAAARDLVQHEETGRPGRRRATAARAGRRARHAGAAPAGPRA
jgi:hypothetical protein